MQFSTIYSRIESLSSVTSQRALIKDAVQTGLFRATAHDLPYLMTDGVITTIAPYETGTVTVSSGSTTVTGLLTTFTSAMVGRKIRVGSENEYYRISAFVSTTEVTLEYAYRGSLTSGNTFSIYKDEYRLASDLDIYKVMRQVKGQASLVDLDNTAFDIYTPSPRAEGPPRYSILNGSKLDTYTTGTVSASINSATITGSSTAWTSVEGLGKGSNITIGSYVYTVKSVDSATQITLYETTTVAVSGGTAYSISLDNYIIQFHPIPDTSENIYYKYQRIVFPLFNDQDVPDLPNQYHHILVTAGLIWAWKTKDKEESIRTDAIFYSQLKEMWERIGYISSNRSRRRASQDLIYMAQTYPSLPSGRGIPFSL